MFYFCLCNGCDPVLVSPQLSFGELCLLSSLRRRSNAREALLGTFNPKVDIPVEIVSVIGAGTLNAEWVVVRNPGEEPLTSPAGN